MTSDIHHMMSNKTGSWASLASMNISKRKNLNVLEIRLEREENTDLRAWRADCHSFHLKMVRKETVAKI